MSIPEHMTAIEITAFGEPSVLQPAQRPMPQPGGKQVLLKVAAAGINRPDVMQRKGRYPPPPGVTDIPGLEIAGSVVALGCQVTHFRICDEVCALVTGGGYAEYCLAEESLCLPVPTGYSLVQAAAIPETFFTVWSNVFDIADLNAGESILIHGGSSGIGTTAIQLAKAMNALVFITAGSDRKCDFCLGLGADAAINYKSDDFVDRILALTNGRGVNVILDMVGGDYLPRNIKCLATDGRLLQIAVQGGTKAEIDLLAVMIKRLRLQGSTLRSRDLPFKAAIATKLKKKIWPLLTNGNIKPVIDSVFHLHDAAKAHQLMESNQHIGKIILTTN